MKSCDFETAVGLCHGDQKTRLIDLIKLDAVRESMAAERKSWDVEFKNEKIDGDLACVGLIFFRFTYANRSENYTYRGTGSCAVEEKADIVYFRKIDGEWKIINGFDYYGATRKEIQDEDR